MATTDFGFAPIGLVFQFVIYCVLGFVVWKFYQMISRISEDLSSVKELLQRRNGEPGLDLELPSDPLP
jgi:hypothetical protein